MTHPLHAWLADYGNATHIDEGAFNKCLGITDILNNSIQKFLRRFDMICSIIWRDYATKIRFREVILLKTIPNRHTRDKRPPISLFKLRYIVSRYTKNPFFITTYCDMSVGRIIISFVRFIASLAALISLICLFLFLEKVSLYLFA